MVAYVTAKSAMDGLMRALALDVADTGVRVNSVKYDFFYTRILVSETLIESSNSVTLDPKYFFPAPEER